MEYRFDKVWIDIFISKDGYKFAIEVNGPGKPINHKKNKFLWINGWTVISVPSKYIDLAPALIAKKVLDKADRLIQNGMAPSSVSIP